VVMSTSEAVHRLARIAQAQAVMWSWLVVLQ